ncbi:MAG TPA: Gfo/Idh/MocA family oxidoreductase [Candidatus Kapabacteria bacterium]|nr:Gfo/Idh/MocA family oxidoreductase [Candidatus Kapabacteria bacterium]
MQRREFLKVVGTGAATVAAPFVLGSTEGKVYTTALIGCGWWGKNILREAIGSGRSKVVGLADVDANVLEVAGEQVTDLNGDKPKLYGDYRELLAKEKPEIVIVSTPDHWHALNTIDALKAGAHVFVEKPTGHSVGESKAMLKTAREAGRVVQVGLHRRIGPHHVSGMEFLKSGKVGKVGMVRLFAHGGGDVEKPSANEGPPETLNWDMWCGPAPVRPFNKRLHPGGWRSFLDYGNGTLGDWGVHWLDQVLCWTEEKYPKRVFCAGGRPVRGQPINDSRVQTTDAPDHQVATYEFENFTCIWEHRQFAENPTEKHKIGAYFYGTHGVLHIGWRDGWTFYPSKKSAETVHQDSELQEPDGHNLNLLWSDFLKAIDSRKTPVSGIETAHRASVLPLLGMISWRTGRSIQWDGANETILNDPEAAKLLTKRFREPWVHPSI